MEDKNLVSSVHNIMSDNKGNKSYLYKHSEIEREDSSTIATVLDDVGTELETEREDKTVATVLDDIGIELGDKQVSSGNFINNKQDETYQQSKWKSRTGNLCQYPRKHST